MSNIFLDVKARNLVLSGNLTVNGTTTTVNSTVVTVVDPLMKLGENNTANLVDLGVYAAQDTGTTATYSGYFKDATDDKIKFFKGLEVEPTTTVNTGGTGFAYAGLVAASLETTNIDIDTTTGVIATVTGDLTLGAVANSNVNVDPTGTGKVIFYPSATNNGYSFPIDAGPSEDGFILVYTDATDSLDWVDPSTFVGADHVRSDANFSNAGAILVSETNATRDTIESSVVITAGAITGVTSLTANTYIPTCTAVSANTTLSVTDYTLVKVTTGATNKTMTLPTDPACGQRYIITKVDAAAGDVVITAGGANTLSDGVATSITLADQYDYISLVFEEDTGRWLIGM